MLETIVMTCAIAAGEQTSWPILITTAGQDVSWQSPSTVRTDATTYDTAFELTSVSVLVSYFGFEFGPIDVTDQIPDLTFSGSEEGPCPVDFGTIQVVEPPPPDPITIGFDLSTSIDSNGVLYFDMTNITLGTASTEVPIFGEVTVQLEELYADGELSITPIGSFCLADLNSDGVVGTDDLLAIIAAWGDLDSPLDINGDGIVGSSDLLLILADWGPCN